jgi:O-antigen ligase
MRWAVFSLLFFIPVTSLDWFPLLNLVYPALVVLLFGFFSLYRITSATETYPLAKTTLSLVLLIAVYLITAIFSKETGFNLLSIKLVYSLLLCFITAKVFSSPLDRKKAVFALLLGAGLVSIYALYQKLIGFGDMWIYLEKHKSLVQDPRVYEEFIKNIGSGRVFSTFLNANAFAGYIAMVLPVAAGYFLYSLKKGGKRYFAGTVVFLLVLALALTRSAGGMTAVLFSLLVLLGLTVKEKKKLLLASAILVFASVIAVLFLRPDIFDFLKADNSILNRINYLHTAFQIFLKYPLFGGGIDSFGILAEGGVKYPHNWYLQTLAESGLSGFAALAFLIYVFVKESIKTLPGIKGAEKYLFAGCFAGFTGFLFHNLFDIDSNLLQNSLIAFMLAGITASGFRPEKFKKAVNVTKGAAEYIRRHFFITTALLLAAGVLLFSTQRFEYEAFTVVITLSALLFLRVISERNKFQKTGLDYFIAMLVLVCFTSLAFSVHRFATLQSLYLLVGCVMLFYTAANRIETADGVGRFSFFAGISCIFLSLIGIFQYLQYGTSGVTGFFPNQNLFGGFLAAGIGFIFFSVFENKGFLKKFYVLSLLLSFTSLLLTKSRGAFLALLAAIICILFTLELFKKKKILSEKNRFWTTVGVLILIGILVTPVNPVVRRAVSIGINDDAAYSRGKMAVSALKIFRDRPLFGHGLGTFKDVAQKHSFSEGGTIGNYTREAHQAHNEYLQILTELGFAGAVFVCFFLFIIAGRYLNIINRTADKNKILTASGIITAITALLVHAAVDFNLRCLPTLLLFVILTGMLFSKYFSGKETIIIRNPAYSRLKLYVTLLLFSILLTAGMTYASVYLYKESPVTPEVREKKLLLSIFTNPWFADSYDGLGKIYGKLYNRTKNRKYFLEAEINFKEAIKKNSTNAFYHKHLAGLYFVSGYKAEAIQEYQKAIQKRPNDVFLKAELAGLYYFTGNYDNAEKLARRAVQLEPNFAGAHGMLCDIYEKMKNKKAAEYERQKALQIYEKYKNTAIIDYEKMLISLGGEK